MGKLTLFDGVKLAYQEWGHRSCTQKILALHGWLDNSNTFQYLGPYLGERGYHVVALDFVGSCKVLFRLIILPSLECDIYRSWTIKPFAIISCVYAAKVYILHKASIRPNAMGKELHSWP